MNIKRGEIYLAALDPVVGNEIAKTRPVLVVSNDINNTHAGTVSVLPITSQRLDKVYPFEVFLPQGTGNLPKDSKVKADQIRTLDKTRLVSRIGFLPEQEMASAEMAIKIHLDLS
ncbi:MAG: Endoribonuclease MazF9 [Syntrophorhabdaceae bacterium]|nr:Endoribonuclease MazF9 [Syntrophorhabdaceae bacterium]